MKSYGVERWDELAIKDCPTILLSVSRRGMASSPFVRGVTQQTDIRENVICRLSNGAGTLNRQLGGRIPANALAVFTRHGTVTVDAYFDSDDPGHRQ